MPWDRPGQSAPGLRATARNDVRHEEDLPLSTTRTSAKALALIAGTALALSACASSSSGGGDTGSTSSATTAPITVTWGYEQEFSSYNSNTADGNASANIVVLNQVLRGFYYFSPDGKVVPDTDFGTFEKTSDNPLTVKYTINDKAVWSDGNAIDCDDAVMSWLANSGLSGAKGWSAAATFGYEDMNKPACKDGDKSFTVTYKKPFADWAGMFGYGALMPAHVVEKGSGVADIIAAADQPTGADSLKAGAYYNTAWKLNPGQLKPEIMPSAGPYTISKWDAGQSLTLEANPKWWGKAPKAKTIVLRYMGGDAMVQALQNGEINLMDPQPQVELVNQLKAAGADKVKFSTGDQFTFEHLDFNFTGVFKDKNLREAFAKCVPRQQIVDNLIKPQNPNAQILQSRLIFPFQPTYSQFESIGGEKYNTADVPGAKALVDASGVKAPIQVRVGWRKDPAAINKRRVDTIALIQASCKGAGFNVVDTGTPDFFDKALPDGNFDVGLFAWSGSPLVTQNKPIYGTGGGSNYGKYTNKDVDAKFDQLNQELDADKQVAIMKEIDTQLWTDLVTIPLFAFPAVFAQDPTVEGAQFNATSQDMTWNAYDWSLKTS
jgi:peptide/nickel transport system substrate-binding protein